MKSFRFIASSLLSSLLFQQFAFADAQGGFNQLEFDRPAQVLKSNNVAKDQLKEILGDSTEPSKQPVVESAPNAKEQSARGRLANPNESAVAAKVVQKKEVKSAPIKQSGKTSGIFEWVKPQDGSSHFLIPVLKGPATDEGNNQAITTVATWNRGKDGCQDVKDRDSQCRKATALKEMLNRFSGSNDFYDAQCGQACPNPGDIAVLTAFAVRTVAGGEFKMSDIGNVCRYQVVSNLQPPIWKMMEGERGTCACLPKGCAE